MTLRIIDIILEPLRRFRVVFQNFASKATIQNSLMGAPQDLQSLWATDELLGPLLITRSGNGYHISCAQKRSPGYTNIAAHITGFSSENVIISSPMSVDFAYQTSTLDIDRIDVRFHDGLGNTLGNIVGFPKDKVELAAPSEDMKIFLFGSCVSRDAFQLESAPELVDYVARSTLSSALGKPADDWQNCDLSANKSSFQRRVIQIDLRKQVRELLKNEEFDYLLMDFIDERLRTVFFGQGSLTYSPELQRAGFGLPAGRVVKFGSDEYFSSFETSFSELLSLVPESKIIINRVFWASIDSEGHQVDWVDSIDDANSHLSRIYSYISRWPGIRFINYDDEYMVAETMHRWGKSPFHFVDSLYQVTITKLQEIYLESF